MTNARNDSQGRHDAGLAAPERLSQVAENYLLSLYILGEEGLRATSGQLAEYIRTLPAGEGLGTNPSLHNRYAAQDGPRGAGGVDCFEGGQVDPQGVWSWPRGWCGGIA